MLCPCRGLGLEQQKTSLGLVITGLGLVITGFGLVITGFGLVKAAASLQLRPYSVNRCTSGDEMGVESNSCGDGWDGS